MRMLTKDEQVIVSDGLNLAQATLNRYGKTQPISLSTLETLNISKALSIMCGIHESVGNDDPIDGFQDPKFKDCYVNGANDRQIGGEHYGLSAFQHWDVVALFKLDYFQGQITKYVMRWRQKNGLPDLQKAAHFLEKYIELARKENA